MAVINEEKVVSVHHWTDSLFSFKTTRDPGFRFRSGQFSMIGLEVEGKPLLRAYSMASAHYEENLEFFSIKVPDGPLTSRLQSIQVGDKVLVNTKPTGTLVNDYLKPGKNLYMLATGTGLAPFLSLIKDPEIYEAYEKVILVHGCRYIKDLAYQDEISQLPGNEFFGDMVRGKLEYYPTVTREPFANTGRITDLMRTGKLFSDLGMQQPNIADDRFMLCGSPVMLKDVTEVLKEWQFGESTTKIQGEYAIERAFVEK